MNVYEISFPTFFREPFATTYEAETAGKAKYQCYLRFSDAYVMPFKDFLKIIKVKKSVEAKPSNGSHIKEE